MKVSTADGASAETLAGDLQRHGSNVVFDFDRTASAHQEAHIDCRASCGRLKLSLALSNGIGDTHDLKIAATRSWSGHWAYRATPSKSAVSAR